MEQVVFPTWTWVSQPTEVSFHCAPKPETHQGIVPLATFVSADAKVDEDSCQVSGSLTLKVSLYSSRLLKDFSINRGEGPLTLHLYWDRKTYESRVDYALDLLGYSGEKNQAWSSFFLQKPKPAKMLLILEPADEPLTRFRRLGLDSWGGMAVVPHLDQYLPDRCGSTT